MPCLLAVDCGLTLVKAVLFSSSGNVVASASSKPATLYPETGWAERNMEDLWDHASRAVRETLARAGVKSAQIACVTVTGYGNGVYCLDGNGKPTRNGILSTDTRASGTAARLRTEGVQRKVHHLTGNRVWPASAAVLLRWIRENEPDVYVRTRRICMAKDYVRFRLTGEVCSDRTDMTTGALADVSRGAFDGGILDAYGIPEVAEMLPTLVDSWAVAGRVSREGARATGLAEGTPAAAGGIDLAMAALGSGCLQAGQLSIVVGTWSINTLVIDSPMISPDILLTACYCSPGRWLLLDGSPTSAANLEWFVEQFCFMEKAEAEARNVSPFEIVDREIAGMEPASCDIVFHPFIFGSDVQPSARGGFYGLAGWHRRQDLLRAVFEGVCFSHLSHVERLRSLRREHETYIAGGGKRSTLWMQMFSDVLDTPIRVPEQDEVSALGSAITGAIAAGVYPDHGTAVGEMCETARTLQPRPDAHSIYMKKYALYNSIIESMTCSWDRMQETSGEIRGVARPRAPDP
jgi:L-xylulokinase